MGFVRSFRRDLKGSGSKDLILIRLGISEPGLVSGDCFNGLSKYLVFFVEKIDDKVYIYCIHCMFTTKKNI